MGITIREIARLAGVSATTASCALDDKRMHVVKAARREHIREVARKYGYNPRRSRSARSLVTGRSYHMAIGLDASLADHPVMGSMGFHIHFAQLTHAIQQAGYAIDIVQFDSNMRPSDIAETIGEEGRDAFVLMGWTDPVLVEDVLFALAERNIPAAATGVTLPGNRFTWTNIDRANCFEQMVELLVKEGHRRLGFIDAAAGINAPLERNAFIESASTLLGVDASGWVHTLTTSSEFNNTLAISRQILESRKDVTAFILRDALGVNGVYEALAQQGLEPGKDIRVIGFGDSVIAEKADPKLSHFNHRSEDQIEFVMQALLEQIEHPDTFTPRHMLFPGKYLPRDT